jgi:glutamine amidotransferase-like uncharacterized protein
VSRPLILVAFVLLTVATSACKSRRGAPLTSSADVPILLFNGSGASPDDVAAVETVLEDNHLEYSTLDSSELSAVSASGLKAHRLLIVPGGNFETIGASLSPATTAKVRDAVQSGLSYLGICAGAFLAGAIDDGLDLTSGVRFHFYADEDRGIRKAAVTIAGAGTPPLDQYWEDGPQLTGWGAVVGRYPDGTPAIVEGASGTGWVILSGVHPEAPASWRHGMTFKTPSNVDNAYAATLVRAALDRTWLSHD